MPTLTIPVPQLVFDPPGGPPQIEKPVTVRLDPVLYPDAQQVTANDMRVLGAFIYRGPLGGEDVWDDKGKSWTTAPATAAGLASMTPLPFTPATGESSPWKTTLVAAGQKDGSGKDRFAKAQGGNPKYRIRAYAHAVRNGVEYRALGSPSADLLFVSAADNARFTVMLDTGDASTATSARMLLKNGSLATAGYLEIRATSGQEVEVANCTASGAVLARITLSSDGHIHLAPAAGSSIVLDGPLEAEQVTYQPSAGGGRQTL